MTIQDAPRYVVPGASEAAAVLRRLTRAGWTAREGFAAPETAWDLSEARLVLHGHVTDLDTVRLAVHAAARGAGVVAVADPASDVGRALVADLGRIGPVRHDPSADPVAEPAMAIDAVDPVHRLVPEQRALLERLANGETIAAAAAAEFLSLRTANRRIAQARELFGVRTTREAVLAYIHAKHD